MNIGKRIAALRKSKNISIYRISQETGISQNHIRDIEQSRRNPSIDTLSRLIVPLGITLSELFNEDIQVSFLTGEERTSLENYRTLPEKKAAFLLEMSAVLNE